MDFISNTEAQNAEMLKKIGIKSVEELFTSIPKKLLLPPLSSDDGLSEYEGIILMEELAKKNSFLNFESYLGAGAYEHHIPAIVGSICSKSEFLTSYTPYQPEASQGMLQSIFEFQSAMCALTGLDVSNASLYDGSSACAEACLMALRIQKNKHKILIANSLHPHYRAVVEQYLCRPDFTTESIAMKSDGFIDLDRLSDQIDDTTAAILVQYPNFFGGIDSIKDISTLAKEKGVLIILCANPLVYGLYASAAEIGADIAVGDCQPLGLSLQFGGPYAGYITCKQEFLRQLPGRIVGETVDSNGKRGFVLTLQAREQHIRREKATSNICTNQALAALATLITTLWYGKEGLHKLAITNFQRASYLRKELLKFTESTPFENQPIFNEFVIKFKKPLDVVLKHFRKHGIEPGVDLSAFYPNMDRCLLVAVTETKSLSQLEKYIQVAKEIC